MTNKIFSDEFTRLATIGIRSGFSTIIRVTDENTGKPRLMFGVPLGSSIPVTSALNQRLIKQKLAKELSPGEEVNLIDVIKPPFENLVIRTALLDSQEYSEDLIGATTIKRTTTITNGRRKWTNINPTCTMFGNMRFRYVDSPDADILEIGNRKSNHILDVFGSFKFPKKEFAAAFTEESQQRLVNDGTIWINHITDEDGAEKALQLSVLPGDRCNCVITDSASTLNDRPEMALYALFNLHIPSIQAYINRPNK